MQHGCKNFSYSFELQQDRIISKRKLQHQNHINSYVNPLTKALEYERILKDKNISKSQLAKKLGISRVRVTQILSLLKIPKKKQDYVLKHGKDEMITERKLRKVLADENL